MDSAAHRQKAFDLLSALENEEYQDEVLDFATLALAHFKAAEVRDEEESREKVWTRLEQMIGSPNVDAQA